jgi:hypothetical protein
MQIKKAVCILALILAAGLFAGSPQFKAFVTQEDLEKGKALGISIDALGQMRLAPAVRERLRASVPYLWCAASDAQGSIYAGGGNPALVLRVTEKSPPDTVFTSAEVAVFAMALAQNNLYIATAPDGQIYRQSGREKAQPFFKPEAKYIWCIAPRQDGALYVATGEPGRVYLVQPNDKAEIFFQSEEKHIRSLALDKNSGTLYAGSSGNGYLYRLTPQGGVSVMYDAAFPEIHQLAIGRDGAVYAAAAGDAGGRPGLIPTPVAAVEGGEPEEEEEGPPISISAAGEDQPQLPAVIVAPGQAGKGAGAVYRCTQDGMVKTLWNSRQDRIHAMLLEASGTLLIGTGDQGRVYRLADDGARTLLFQLESSQITSILAGANGTYLLTTANAGTLQQMQPAAREKGEYLSDVIDAKVPSQWGAVNWQTPAGPSNEGQARLFTRSGNTGKPDKTWSEWTAVQGPATGGAIASPAARFLQWKIEMTSSGKTSAVVKRVQVSYLQKNAAPEVTAINIYNPGDAFPEAKEQAANHLSDGQDGGSPVVKSIPPPESGRKTFQKGAQSIGWQARDENNDRLIYRIEIRAVGENAWRELAKDYAGTVYTWDSQALPDGEYQIRISASDQRSNPPSLALSSEKVSEIFIVDNTPPEVKNLAVQKSGGQWQASFEAADQLSRLKEAWYAVDADKWQLIYPADNVADQRRETFQFTLPANAAPTATSILAVKVVDANGNSGFGKVIIK